MTSNPDVDDTEDAGEEEGNGASEVDGNNMESEGGRLPAQNNWRLVDGLPVFDAQTGQDIDNLLASIEDQVAAGNSAHKWVPAEEDLLLLLRRFRLSYADISTVSLTMITGMVLPCESG